MKKAVILLLLLLLGLLYYTFNPVGNILFPKCPFLALTGFKCPGCGSQRAIHSLLHFDFPSAFQFNALLVLSLPIVAVLIYAELNRTKKTSLYAALHKPVIILGFFSIIVVWWVARNIFAL